MFRLKHIYIFLFIFIVMILERYIIFKHKRYFLYIFFYFISITLKKMQLYIFLYIFPLTVQKTRWRRAMARNASRWDLSIASYIHNIYNILFEYKHEYHYIYFYANYVYFDLHIVYLKFLKVSFKQELKNVLLSYKVMSYVTLNSYSVPNCRLFPSDKFICCAVPGCRCSYLMRTDNTLAGLYDPLPLSL